MAALQDWLQCPIPPVTRDATYHENASVGSPWPRAMTAAGSSGGGGGGFGYASFSSKGVPACPPAATYKLAVAPGLLGTQGREGWGWTRGSSGSRRRSKYHRHRSCSGHLARRSKSPAAFGSPPSSHDVLQTVTNVQEAEAMQVAADAQPNFHLSECTFYSWSARAAAEAGDLHGSSGSSAPPRTPAALFSVIILPMCAQFRKRQAATEHLEQARAP